MRMMCRFRKRLRPSQLRPDGLLLRTLQAPHHVQHEDGSWRVSSGAFSAARDGGCSIDLGQLLDEDGLPLTALYPSLPGSVGLASIDVATVRAQGGAAEHAPVATDWYHGNIRDGDQRVRKFGRKLAGACKIIVEIDPELARQYHEGRGPMEMTT